MADGIFSFLRQDPNQMPQRTFMSRLGSAAAVLNPMNPMASQYGQMMDARLQQRRQEYTRNRSIEELQRRAQGGDKLAERYLSSVQSGALQPGQAFSAYYQQMASEDQFRRQQAAVAGREQATLAREQEKRNRTAEFLRSQGMEGAAGLVESGMFTGPQAIEFTKSQRNRELAEQAAAALQAGDNTTAMAILTQLSPTAMGQQIAARTTKPKSEIIGGGKYTVTYDDAGVPSVSVNQEVVEAERRIKEQQKVAEGLPTDARKAEESDFQALETLGNLIEDTESIVELFGYNPETGQFTGALDIGPTGFAAGALGSVGLGFEEQAKARREFERFKTRFVNNSLRLNKGVQTEGDAQRAARELETASTEATAYAAIQELQKINQRAYANKAAEINRRRARFGLPPIDVPAAPVAPDLQWSIKE